jgi:type VI protein secretion system component VasK
VIVPVGTFFPGDGWMPWLIAWAIGVVIIVPWSIWSLIRVKNTDWKDIEVPAEEEEFDDVQD